MAVSIPKPCAHLGCPRLVASGRCDVHKAERTTPKRTGYSQRIYDHRWRRLRAAFLREHPLCVECGALANVVDHVTPHRGDERLMWAEDNLQPMCDRCHRVKTARGE